MGELNIHLNDELLEQVADNLAERVAQKLEARLGPSAPAPAARPARPAPLPADRYARALILCAAAGSMKVRDLADRLGLSAELAGQVFRQLHKRGHLEAEGRTSARRYLPAGRGPGPSGRESANLSDESLVDLLAVLQVEARGPIRGAAPEPIERLIEERGAGAPGARLATLETLGLVVSQTQGPTRPGGEPRRTYGLTRRGLAALVEHERQARG